MEALTENSSTTTENCCKTEINVVECSYKWSIQNFSVRPERVGGFLTSPTFSARHFDKYKWNLCLYPKGEVGFGDYMALGLNHVSPSNAVVNFSFYLLDDENKKILWHREIGQRFKQGYIRGLSNIFDRNYLLHEPNGLLRDDTLIIICDIAMILETIYATNKGKVIKKPKCDSKIIENLCHLFENMKFSDITLIVGESEIKAHKNILAARSAIFEAMFEHGMKESKSNRVYITDISYKVIQEMLRFIYTGHVSNFDDNAAELLMAAEKYALVDLKELCEMELCGELSVENAADMLILADVYRADNLKAQSIEFISAHVMDVLKTEGWKKMITSHTHLITDTVEAIAKCNGPPRKYTNVENKSNACNQSMNPSIHIRK